MKKGLIVLTVFAFVFTMAAPLFAADVTIGGELRIRGRFRDNRDFDKSTLPGGMDRARLDERSRIRVSAKIEEGLSAYMELESYGRFAFGAASPQANTEDTFGREGAGVPAFRFAWIDARLPGTPLWFRLGRQAQAFGHGYVFDTTTYGGDAITARGPLWGWNWELGWVKTRESDVTNFARDYPPGYAQPAAAAGTGTAGVDNDEEYFTFTIKGSPGRNHALEFYTVVHRDAGCFLGTAGCTVGGAGATGGPTAGAPFGIQSGGGALEGTSALAWDARFGPFVPRAEVAFQYGTAYRLATATTAGGNNRVSRSAYMWNLGADYNLTPEWRFSLDAAQGSGNGQDPSNPAHKHDHAFFQANALQSGPWFFADDLGNPGAFAMGNGTTNRTFSVNGVTNLVFVNLAVAWTPVAAWTFQVEGAKLIASKTFDGVGGLATNTKPSRNLGEIVAGRVTYRPYRNLTTIWWAGAWIPGRYFDGGISTPTATGFNGGKLGPAGDTAIILRWHAIVSF